MKTEPVRDPKKIATDLSSAVDSLSQRIIRRIRAIPPGRVATYGQIAMMAGNPRAARAVFWILSSSSQKYKLPWHRVVNGQGRISLKPGTGFEEQLALLRLDGVEVDEEGRLDLEKYQYRSRRK
jgi:methylated-DNA-protein-cysteine methyltransferase related protein